MGVRQLIRHAVALVLVLAVGAFAHAGAPAAAGSSATASTAADLKCRMHFSLDSWAVLFKHAKGHGTVTCTNGQSMDVTIDANGGGLTVGKAEIAGGTAKFTGVTTIRDVLGAYIGIDSTTAVDKLGDSGQAFSNGPVGMLLYGKSEGVSLGTAFEGMTIKEAQ